MASAKARGVPFAKAAKHFAVLASDAKGSLSIALVDVTKCRIETGLNLGGDNSDTVTLDKVQPVTIKPAPQGFDQTRLMLMGGVARSLQIAGALESMLEISVRYSNERIAFEKKISKFQAVQHNLARLAGESAAALAAGRWTTAALSLLALPTVGLDDGLLMLALALLAGEATTLITSIGAIASHARAGSDGRSALGPGTSTIGFRAAFPFAANSVLNLAYNRFDIIVLAALSTPQQLGLYAPASRIQDALYLVPVVISTIGFPLVARIWQSGRGAEATRALLRTMMVLGVVLSLPATILVFVYAEDLISLVLGQDYVGASTATRILIWFLPFAALTSPLIVALAAADRASDTTRIFLAAFLVAMTMHASLDWWWGATGAAVASLSREPAALLVALFYARAAGLLGRWGQPVRPRATLVPKSSRRS